MYGGREKEQLEKREKGVSWILYEREGEREENLVSIYSILPRINHTSK